MSGRKKGQFKESVARFFAGRYGADELGRFLSWFSMGLLILSLIFTATGLTAVGSIGWYAALGIMIWSWFRMFSKNIYKRQGENRKYLALKSRIKRWFASQKQRLKDLKNYKYFKCPQCKCTLRVPRHKGTLNISCKKCGHKFQGKT